ncbi:hypothetical protein [Paraburkholderia atlantica]|uniref:Uncharacterized protein n=1 Tax=Paraburkholderia atlantica TaxID=2654982 RepID=D5WNL6_PARAM|nr:hypothetical protein [Paraburkholderia atlantica]ADG20895.1 hypothetical protein BC1002_7149 [Paraburkholderia atlantica]MBB5510968.1 hypothetical protein [Paraburkholderia atlantica]
MLEKQDVFLVFEREDERVTEISIWEGRGVDESDVVSEIADSHYCVRLSDYQPRMEDLHMMVARGVQAEKPSLTAQQALSADYSDVLVAIRTDHPGLEMALALRRSHSDPSYGTMELELTVALKAGILALGVHAGQVEPYGVIDPDGIVVEDQVSETRTYHRAKEKLVSRV